MKTYPLATGRDLIIREAQPDDATELLQYIEQTSGESDFLTFGPGEFSLTLEQERSYLQSCIDAPNALYTVGELSGKIVATCHCHSSPRRKLRHLAEMGMSTLKAHWGKGIGRAMLSHMMGWAHNNPELSKLDLGVRTDNTKAISLYRKLGFQEEGVRKKQHFINGQYYDVMWMGLDVSGTTAGE